MSFNFTLSAVLRYRKELEKREERILEQHREVLSKLEKQLAELRAGLQMLARERCNILERGAIAHEIQALEATLKQMELFEIELSQKIVAAKNNYDNQMKRFLHARQRHEIVAELKDQQEEAYYLEYERREQQSLNEMFLSRRHREQ